ncbi:MAG: hypothetical protein JWN05_686 [Arthrobacter sp.]|jgi:hypothetical protein|nr:hypothetical protein [Arthrobacter sp.]
MPSPRPRRLTCQAPHGSACVVIATQAVGPSPDGSRSVHPRLMLRERCSSAPTSYRSRTRRLQGIPGRPSRQRSGSRKRALGHFRGGQSAPSRQRGPLWICAAGTIRALEPAAVTKRARPASRIPTSSSPEVPPMPWLPASGYPSGNWSPITSSPEGGRYPPRTARPSSPNEAKMMRNVPRRRTGLRGCPAGSNSDGGQGAAAPAQAAPTARPLPTTRSPGPGCRVDAVNVPGRYDAPGVPVFKSYRAADGKTLFQSRFMSTTAQPLALASSSAESSLPMCEVRS